MYEQIDAYVLGLIEKSSPQRTAWDIESIRAGRPASWNYIDGCMITSLLAISEITGDRCCYDFAEGFIDWFVLEDGTIRSYDPERCNLDDINEGRALFPLYEKTGKEKYKKAAKMLYGNLMRQPRTFEGNFWHKAIYPNQRNTSARGITATSSPRSKTYAGTCSTRAKSSTTTAMTPAAAPSGPIP